MSQNKIQKAVVAQVVVGNLLVEGLMLPNGGFAIAVPQVIKLFPNSVPQNRSAKQLKSLLGIDFPSHQVKSELNSKAVNIILLEDLEKLIVTLARKGDEDAIELTINLVGLSLNQLFSDAFNIKFEQQERQNWLKIRQQGKQIRRTLTDSIKDWLSYHHTSDNQKRFIYATVTDMINLGIFNRKAQNLKSDWRCHNPRDLMNDNELRWVSEVEDLAMRLIDYQGFTPYDATKEAINRLSIPLVSR